MGRGACFLRPPSEFHKHGTVTGVVVDRTLGQKVDEAESKTKSFPLV